MSKRSAMGEQGSRDGPGSPFSDEMDQPQRADAATLAGRKILSGKRRRAPGSPGPSNPDTLGNIFGGSTSNTNDSTSQNMFSSSFGQQPPASSNFGSSQSFPPASNGSAFSGSAWGATAGENKTTSFGSMPSTGFSFGGPPTTAFNQPQTSSMNGQSAFSGSVFGQPSNNIFAGFGQKNGTSSNVESDMQISPEATPSKSNTERPSMFGSSSGFASSPASNNLFGQRSSHNASKESSPTPTSLFASAPTTSEQNLAPSFAFGATPTKPATSSSFNFSAGASTPAISNGLSQTTSSSFQFGGSSTPQAPASNLFSFGSTNAASPAVQPSVSSSPFEFGGPSVTTQTKQTDIFSPSAQETSGSSAASPFKFGSTSSAFAAPNVVTPPASSAPTPFGGFGTQKGQETQAQQMLVKDAASPASTFGNQASTASATNGDGESVTSKAQYELRSLNEGFRKMLATMDSSMDWSGLMHAYISHREAILNAERNGVSLESTKRRADDNVPNDNSKKSKLAEVPQTSSQTPAKEKSQTLNLFQSIVDGGDSAQQASSASNLFAPKTPTGSSTQSSSTTFMAFPSFKMPEASGTTNAAASALPQSATPQPQAPSNPFASLKTPAPTPVQQPAAKAATPGPFIFKPATPAAGSGLTNSFGADVKSKVPATANPSSSTGEESTMTSAASAPAPAPAPAFKPPMFGNGGAPSNFLAQFGQAAEKEAAKEKAKRKAEEFDSEEDDEEEWERQYAEKQKLKKEELESKTKATFKAPTFGGGSGTPNFLAQFGQSAEQEAAKEKAKRKAEEFDSEEDDEEEWERQYAEKQKMKKAELDDTAKAKVAKFVPGQGFILEEPDIETSTSQDSSEVPANPFTAFTVTTGSVFGNNAGQSSSSTASNIFANLANKQIEADGNDSEDEDQEIPPLPTTSSSKTTSASEHNGVDDTLEDAMRSQNGAKPASQQGSGKSLFERISPANANQVEGVTLTPAKPLFNFGQPASTPTFFGSSTSLASDHTWKVDSPIKFGSNPTLNVEAATPTKPESFVLGGSTTPAGKPFAGLFGNNTTGSSSNLFGQPASSQQSGGLFNFGHVASKSSSITTSRATSPGTDSGAVDSANDTGADGDAEPPLAQTELTGLSETEKREEEVLFEVQKALCKQFIKSTEGPTWENKGTGPLRVLKHKESGVTRILLRAAPAGRVIINSRVLKDTENTQRSPKLVQFLILGTDGRLQTWTAQVGKAEDATRFKTVLDDNKPT